MCFKVIKEKGQKAWHSIRFKINLAVAIIGLILLIFNLWLLTDSMRYMENDLVNDRLASEINVLRDTLDPSGEEEWREVDGALYLGGTLIGDGTMENANTRPFYHCGELTGTFFYTFVRTYNDDELVYVESGGYQQGHYMRVAGNTKGPNDEDLEGTYIDKIVADALESSEDGVFSGDANVKGRMIFCRYELLYDESGRAVGIIVDGRSTEEMEGIVHRQRARGFILITVSLLFLSIGLGVIVYSILGAIKKIRERLEVIGTGEFPEEPLDVRTNDEIGDIAKSINSMVDSLREKELIVAELDVATHIQSSMLPCIFPPFPDRHEFDIYATMDPAKEVGGDFYDFFMVDEKHLAIVIADVSGKGVPAALFMVIAKTLLKDHTHPGCDLGEVFGEVNDILCESNSEGLFVTVFEGVIDLETGEFRFANAGHEIPFICKKNEKYKPYPIKSGFVLAGMDGMKYKSSSLMLEPGDKIFQYTDGVTEATDANGELYGMQRLEKILADNSDKAPDQLLPAVKDDIDAFVGAAPQFDDITMLCLEYKQPMKRDGE